MDSKGILIKEFREYLHKYYIAIMIRITKNLSNNLLLLTVNNIKENIQNNLKIDGNPIIKIIYICLLKKYNKIFVKIL